jgi:hypothetical protein
MGNSFGSHCCAFCLHNMATKRFGIYPMGLFTRKSKVTDWISLSACSLRKVRVPFPHDTYCSNWTFNEANVEAPVDGPIYTTGHVEENVIYPHIPWHGSFQPDFQEIEGTCSVCKRKIEQGVAVASGDGYVFKFCCNSHYMKWWFENHPGEKLLYSYHQLHDPDGV